MSVRIVAILLALAFSSAAELDVEAQALEFLKGFDEQATELMYQYSLASWAYNTNITEENSNKVVGIYDQLQCAENKIKMCSEYGLFFFQIQTEQGEIWSNFYSLKSEESLKYPIDQIKDPEIKLQLISLQDKGSGALTPDKASRVRPSPQ